MRTRTEIMEQIGRAIEQIEEGRSKFPGMSFEEGVDEALRWALGDSDDPPMEDE